MPRAEITWNGVAKSYKVDGQEFRQSRSRTEDWSDELYDYLKTTKGFTIVDKDPLPAPPKPLDEPKLKDEDEPKDEPKDEPRSGPSSRRRR